MELKNLIGQYTLLTPELVSVFLKTFHNVKEFTPAEVTNQKGQGVNLNHRVVQNYPIKCGLDISLTETHWFNFIGLLLQRKIEKYNEDKQVHYTPTILLELTLLKYEQGGFYKPHVDSGMIHRELSAIVFLNNDYEGGHLQFFEPNHKDLILDIKPEIGKVVLWPSNFLFPHQATPVTKGTRFVLVSWMI